MASALTLRRPAIINREEIPATTREVANRAVLNIMQNIMGEGDHLVVVSRQIEEDRFQVIGHINVSEISIKELKENPISHGFHFSILGIPPKK